MTKTLSTILLGALAIAWTATGCVQSRSNETAEAPSGDAAGAVVASQSGKGKTPAGVVPFSALEGHWAGNWAGNKDLSSTIAIEASEDGKPLVRYCFQDQCRDGTGTFDAGELRFGSETARFTFRLDEDTPDVLVGRRVTSGGSVGILMRRRAK